MIFSQSLPPISIVFNFPNANFQINPCECVQNIFNYHTVKRFARIQKLQLAVVALRRSVGLNDSFSPCFNPSRLSDSDNTSTTFRMKIRGCIKVWQIKERTCFTFQFEAHRAILRIALFEIERPPWRNKKLSVLCAVT